MIQAAHFHATYHHDTHQLSFKTAAPTPEFATGLGLESITQIADPSGVDGSPAAGQVDLASPNGCTQTTTNGNPTVTCDVELIWGSITRSLPNPVVQIALAGIDQVDAAQVSGYDGVNSDPQSANPLWRTSNNTGIPTAHGLWAYTNEAINPGHGSTSGPYYLTASGTGFNTGTRTWILGDPDNGDVDYEVLVFASLNYADYETTITPGQSALYQDVCSLPQGTASTASSVTLRMPIDFSLYNQNYKNGHIGPNGKVNFAKNGQITFGNVGLTASTTPLSLPSTSAPAPSFFPFWDDLAYGTAGKLCYATIGTAPQPQFVIEWRNMTINEDPGSNLDFEVFLSEGYYLIQTLYEVATPGDDGGVGREEGSGAWVGMQNATGNSAHGTFDVAQYAAGDLVTYTPLW